MGVNEVVLGGCGVVRMKNAKCATDARLHRMEGMRRKGATHLA